MMLADAVTLENGMIFVVGALALTFLSLGWARRAQRRMASSTERNREDLRLMREQATLPSTMSELMVQLEDFSRRINAQLDTKFARLETVVRDADDRIARLEALLKQTGQTKPQPTPKAQPAATTPPREARPTNADRDERRKEPAAVDAAKTDVPSPGSVAVNPNLLPRHETAQRVYALADGGASAIQIAEQTELPLGEVELLLNLRQM